jgi:uncharacterized membrane protein
MGLIDRVKNILITPRTEWDVIAAETTPPKALILGYVLPLALAAAIAGFVSSALIGYGSLFGGTFRMPIGWALGFAVYRLVASLVSVFVVAFIVDALAPTFGAQKNFNQALKLVAYTLTAGMVGSVLAILPYLGVLLALILGLYGIYLLYLGLPKLMRNPEDKSVAYTAVVIVVAIVVGVILGWASRVITGPAMMGSARMGMAPSATYDRSSPMGKLDEFGKKMDEASKRMEAAQKSGDPKKQMEAAMGALGTAMSGGKGVEPVQLDALKPLVPATFAGLPQTSTQSERSGVPGLMIAKVQAGYGDSSGKSARLEVVDTGGAAGLMGLASWMGIQGEREDDNRREATRKEGGRLVHEEIDKRGGRNKYSVVLADRFVVSANGNGIDIDALKSAVGALDLGKIEALK